MNQAVTTRRLAHAKRRGMSMFYLMIILTLTFAIASLALDYGRVQLAKTQLQINTDAAVKWAAKGGQVSKPVLLARANDAGADNPVNGAIITYAAGDLQTGSWNLATRTFTPNGSPTDAIKLTGTTVVPLMMGSLIQKPSVTIRASGVARVYAYGGMVGLNGITVWNNMFMGSYDSTVTTNPTEETAGTNATISSNGVISAFNNGVVNGSLHYGPSGSVDAKRWAVAGTTTQLSTAIAAPAEPAWNPSGNPGSISQNYTHTGGSLPGGTYYFTSLSVTAPLTFTGPATVYVNGNIVASGNNSNITAYGGLPGNLKIFQIGEGRTFITQNDLTIKAVVVAPRSDFEARNKISFYGQIVFNTVTLRNAATFFYDESTAITRSLELVQ